MQPLFLYMGIVLLMNTYAWNAHWLQCPADTVAHEKLFIWRNLPKFSVATKTRLTDCL